MYEVLNCCHGRIVVVLTCIRRMRKCALLWACAQETKWVSFAVKLLVLHRLRTTCVITEDCFDRLDSLSSGLRASHEPHGGATDVLGLVNRATLFIWCMVTCLFHGSVDSRHQTLLMATVVCDSFLWWIGSLVIYLMSLSYWFCANCSQRSR